VKPFETICEVKARSVRQWLQRRCEALLERYDGDGGEVLEALLVLLDCRRRKGRDGTRYVEK
jgi:hypothetical protein